MFTTCAIFSIGLLLAVTTVLAKTSRQNECVRTFCADNQAKIGEFCYEHCPAGYARFGFDCHSVCPQGMRNDGLFCRRSEYGRGAGYPWKFGDALNDNAMFERCRADNPQLGCEKHGLIVYPKCRDGYSAFGCCICRPERPDCGSLGLGTQVDLSCSKRIIIGKPQKGTCLYFLHDVA
ncbi:hypothetical protein LSTR_LSTR004464 [Laodelphax striatellus]|uniref:Uncharacterized protein n=1 Tax=Laodelphax striatellus TaxID=195883 RepID=A0A482XEJ5_LAOST|nr:hypothetical protein LSTR_LSTR004464 [Laodelphax striatellus]